MQIYKEGGNGEIEVKCPYCQLSAELVDSSVIYGRSYGMIWLCQPCRAYVGCHRNSPRHFPLGTLANEETRQWRKKAHTSFDVLWKSNYFNRTKAYHWLANKLNISYNDCHISWFDVETCKKVVGYAQKFLENRQGAVHVHHSQL